ncbi:DNA cytosine methyltransferase [Pseudomonas syringae group genomosp. 3]|nr:DNA cytosine methyltransferase [Pseudomonas syringae group genomosp. 3]
MYFIDVFAGCGGLSLGLMNAGLVGLIAIEKNPMAFETLRHNLIDGEDKHFEWPDWLPKKAMTCEYFLENYASEIIKLKGKVDVLVGGPPCQGFSVAGKRNSEDPRNKMASKYLELVKILSPKYLVIENVSGFNMPFKSVADETVSKNIAYSDYICSELVKLGYAVSRGKVNCADFGVPQNRHRYLIMCTRDKDVNLISDLIGSKKMFLESKGLNVQRPVSVHEAIADLETQDRNFIRNNESGRGLFREAEYVELDIRSPYLSLMRSGVSYAPNSRRLPNHKPETILHFLRVKLASEPGRSLSKSARDKLGIKKHAITVLGKDLPAPTITTLPDDIIHYSELRILTVRETARLQSFPDWFEFIGKYTTGGKMRKADCPRYTQVGNAVPPMLSEAIGVVIGTCEQSNMEISSENYGKVKL